MAWEKRWLTCLPPHPCTKPRRWKQVERPIDVARATIASSDKDVDIAGVHLAVSGGMVAKALTQGYENERSISDMCVWQAIASGFDGAPDCRDLQLPSMPAANRQRLQRARFFPAECGEDRGREQDIRAQFGERQNSRVPFLSVLREHCILENRRSPQCLGHRARRLRRFQHAAAHRRRLDIRALQLGAVA